MFVARYSRTMAGAQRLAEQRGRSFPAIEPPKPKPASVAVPVAVEKPAKPVVGLCTRNVVVVNFTPRTKTQQIIADMAHQHGVTYADVISKSRRHHFVKARTEAIWALKDWNPSLSLPQIGRLMGGRDHTTILHALRKRGL
ncbi:helix-turn-helix domain-containing protein [Mesorhizobium sp. M0088]|uniref:helix-turn-helix domain-containing protein n=1 Tax=Mesorhizobium sp. M0088 TaxID=2956873 RepID=UPI0033374450